MANSDFRISDGWNCIRTPEELGAYRQQFLDYVNHQYELTRPVHGWGEPAAYPVLLRSWFNPIEAEVTDIYVYLHEAVGLVVAAQEMVPTPQLPHKIQQVNLPPVPQPPPQPPEPAGPTQHDYNAAMAAQHMALVELLIEQKLFTQKDYLTKVTVMHSVVDQFKAENRDRILQAMGEAAVVTAEMVPRK